MRKLSVLAWIGNAAAVVSKSWGAVTAQATQAGCSRQTAYRHANQVQEAVAARHSLSKRERTLQEENHRLLEENRQLWQAVEHCFDCAKPKRRRFAATAAAMGLSLQQTQTLLAILLPLVLVPSRPTLGRWVRQAACRAGQWLRVLDKACRALVLCLCLDEIFLHRQPVLMAIEPWSLASVLARREIDCSGPAWCRALADWPALEDVAADGGSGLALGLELTARKRQEDADRKGVVATPLRVGLDVFHTRREGSRALRAEWAAAEAAWVKAERTERAKVRFDRGGTDRRKFKKDVVAKAWEQATAAFETAQRKEKAWQRAVAALALFRPDHPLNTRAWAEAEIQAAVLELDGPRWAKVRRMLSDERALVFLDRLEEEMRLAEPCAERRTALLAVWRWRRSVPRQRSRRQPEPGATMSPWPPLVAVLSAVVVQKVGPDGWAAYRRIARVLERAVRASSAVECINSVVRMHQARHRRLTQELLDLKRLYWNCRSFAAGKRRGKCPYKLLGLRLPTYELGELLRLDPEAWKQEVSTARVAA
jgi:hypothetical protein